MTDPNSSENSRFPTTASDLKTLVAQVTLETKRDIRQSQGDSGQIAAVEKAYRRFDHLIQLGHAALPPDTQVECVAGCTYCCRHPRQYCTKVEAKAITEWLRTNLSEDDWAAMKAKIRQYALQLASTEGSYGLTCVFLKEDDMCSIYPVRPVVCRGQNSTSQEACRLGYGLRDPRVNIPIVYTDQQLGFAFLKGFMQGPASDDEFADMAAMIIAELDQAQL